MKEQSERKRKVLGVFRGQILRRKLKLYMVGEFSSEPK